MTHPPDVVKQPSFPPAGFCSCRWVLLAWDSPVTRRSTRPQLHFPHLSHEAFGFKFSCSILF